MKKDQNWNQKTGFFSPKGLYFTNSKFIITIKTSNLLHLNLLWEHEYIKSIYNHPNLILQSKLNLPHHLNV